MSEKPQPSQKDDTERYLTQETLLWPENVKVRHDVHTKNAPDFHAPAKGLSDVFARAACNTLGMIADLFFQKRYGNRAIVLETVAAIPGTVAGFHHALYSYRKIEPDNALIRTLMEEAENERMHLRIFSELIQPTKFERALVYGTQFGFTIFFSLAYFLHNRTAHRFVGYIEEKAVDSYTKYLHEIDEGRIENVPAPQIAIDYYNLPQEARLRDVVIAVRLDEMEHRDVNHDLADGIDPLKPQP
jgi:ubiquinol oxidase